MPKTPGYVIWLTGLTGAGKTTLAIALQDRLARQSRPVLLLDGDAVRTSLSTDLGFSLIDRSENARRVAEVAASMCRSGAIVVVSLISPRQQDRDHAREVVVKAHGRFYEVHLDASLEVCEARDCKGLYRLARAGGIKDFTGLSLPYEAPLRPDVSLPTGEATAESCLASLLAFLLEREHCPPKADPALLQ